MHDPLPFSVHDALCELAFNPLLTAISLQAAHIAPVLSADAFQVFITAQKKLSWKQVFYIICVSYSKCFERITGKCFIYLSIYTYIYITYI